MPADKYAAMGDSFSSGEGTVSDEGPCQQSPDAYGPYYNEVYARPFLDVTFTACTGHIISELVEDQLVAVPVDSGLVTLTIGGNDVGFRDVLIHCIAPGVPDCRGGFPDLESEIDALRIPLADAYRAILTRAPQATVVVLTYPYLVTDSTEPCASDTVLKPYEKEWIRLRTAQLQEVIAGAAALVGSTRLSVLHELTAFAGHEACTSDEWVNGFSLETPNSFHPNTSGQHRLAEDLRDHLAAIGWYS